MHVDNRIPHVSQRTIEQFTNTIRRIIADVGASNETGKQLEEYLEQLQEISQFTYHIELSPDDKFIWVADPVVEKLADTQLVFNQVVGNNLKTWRTYTGMSQKEVGDEIGCSVQAYSKYETGSRALPLDLLAKLAKLFSVTTDKLIYPPVGLRNIPQYKPYSKVNDNIHVVEIYFDRGGRTITHGEYIPETYDRLYSILDGRNRSYAPIGYTVAKSGETVLLIRGAVIPWEHDILSTNNSKYKIKRPTEVIQEEFSVEGVNTYIAQARQDQRRWRAHDLEALRAIPVEIALPPYEIGGSDEQAIEFISNPVAQLILDCQRFIIHEGLNPYAKESTCSKHKSTKKQIPKSPLEMNINRARHLRTTIADVLEYRQLSDETRTTLEDYMHKLAQLTEPDRELDFYKYHIELTPDDKFKWVSDDMIVENEEGTSVVYTSNSLYNVPPFNSPSAPNKNIYFLEIVACDQDRAITQEDYLPKTYAEIYDVLSDRSRTYTKPLGYAIAKSGEALLVVRRRSTWEDTTPKAPHEGARNRQILNADDVFEPYNISSGSKQIITFILEPITMATLECQRFMRKKDLI